MTDRVSVLGDRPITFHPVFGGEWSPEPDPPDGYDEWPTMGGAAAAWIQAKTGLVLDPWQVEILWRGMAYHPDTLDWLVHDVLIVGPEAIGKSAFLGGLADWWLDAPCMPPVEAPQPYPSPNIPVVSAALTLTQHVRKYATQYVEQAGLGLAERIECEKTRLFRKGSSDPENEQVFFPTGSGAMQQGANPRPVIIEEELHVLNASGVKANGIETVRVFSDKRTKTTRWYDLAGRPRPLSVQRWTITNPDDGDPNSLLGERWKYAQAVLDGEVVDPTMLVIWFHAAEPVDIDDPADLRRGIGEANPASWKDVDKIARKYERGDQSASRCRRFSLGLFWAGEDQVVPEGMLEGAEIDCEALGIPPGPNGLGPPPPPDTPVALAFDGARNRDSVALTGCTADGYGFTIACWEPPEDRDGWRGHDKEAIHDRVVQAMDVDHPEAVLAVDPTWFEDFAVRGWRNAAGQQVLAWVDRWPGRVVLDVQKYGAAAWSGWLQALRNGDWFHDGDPRTYRHMRNAKIVRKTRDGREYELLAKKRDDGDHPIDLLVTHTYAHRLATTVDATGPTTDQWMAAMGVATEETDE